MVHTAFLYASIHGMARSHYDCILRRVGGGDGDAPAMRALSRRVVRWLMLHAFVTVLERRQARYPELLRRLRSSRS